MVSGATRSLLKQAKAIASGVTRSIQATFSPNALAPQASHGFDDTNSTSVGATPRRASHVGAAVGEYRHFSASHRRKCSRSIRIEVEMQILVHQALEHG